MKIYFPILPLCFIIFTIHAQIPMDEDLEIVADFGKNMVIGVSVNSENRVFVSFPGHNGQGHLALTEVRNGQILPYPDETWNAKGDYENTFLRIQDLYVDSEDMLWVLDSKPSGSGNIFGDGKDDPEGSFKLVKINTQTNQTERVYLFDDLDKSRSALNDVRVDTEKNQAYFSDPGMAAIVVMDLESEKTRVLLEDSEFTRADDIVPVYQGREMKNPEGKSFSSHINGIALTHDFKYFYFKPINKRELFRIETRYLADTTLRDDDLRTQVKTFTGVGITHGLIADKKGNVFLTTSESYSISYISPDGRVHTLVRDPRLIWPDSLGIGTDGYLYFSCAQIQRLPQWNGGEDKTDYPYQLYKIKLP